ncbi:hypothetical protein L1887_55248 [Cichorium endivia]|nr:hypothetical protein L1887_55248 [Cichorium endivia]
MAESGRVESSRGEARRGEGSSQGRRNCAFWETAAGRGSSILPQCRRAGGQAGRRGLDSRQAKTDEMHSIVVIVRRPPNRRSIAASSHVVAHTDDPSAMKRRRGSKSGRSRAAGTRRSFLSPLHGTKPHQWLMAHGSLSHWPGLGRYFAFSPQLRLPALAASLRPARRPFLAGSSRTTRDQFSPLPKCSTSSANSCGF